MTTSTPSNEVTERSLDERQQDMEAEALARCWVEFVLETGYLQHAAIALYEHLG